jgi:thiol-disulfide isomerase/thioredoxin
MNTVLLFVVLAVAPQSLGEAAKRAEEARKAAGTASVTFDMRDIEPAIARQELLTVQLDDARWTRFLAVQPQFARAVSGNPATSHWLLQTQVDNVRELEKFIAASPELVAAIRPLAPREYAATHLAALLALQESGGTPAAIDALPSAVRANVAFARAREREIKALSPAVRLTLKILPADTRSVMPVASRGRVTPPAAGTHTPVAEPIDPGGPVALRPGTEVPDFRFVDFNGNSRNLSDFRGRYLMLDFWGSWCPPCRAEVPFARAAYSQFRARGFDILGMDYERGASLDQVRAYLSENGVSWTFAQPDSVRSLIVDRFQIKAFPAIYLIGPDGRVLDIPERALRGTALAATLDKVLPR